MSSILRQSLLIPIAALLVGCATSGGTDSLIFTTSNDEVRGCMITTPVESKDAFYDRMIKAVQRQANAAGSTHVLEMQRGSVGCGVGMCAYFAGVAYRCR